MRLLNSLPVLKPGWVATTILALLTDLLHLLVVERLDVAFPNLHDVVTDFAMKAL